MSVMTEVEYNIMLERLLGRISKDYGISFSPFSLAMLQNGDYHSGDWTYDHDSAFQVTLCRWLGPLKHICEKVLSPTPIVSPEEEARFEDVLRQGVKRLIEE